MDLNFYIADFTRPGISWNDRAKVTGRLGNYMFSVARLLPGQFSAVEIHWIEPMYAPSLGDTDILVYLIPTIDWSVIKANGGSVSVAMTNSKIAGLTDVTNIQPISELYWDRMFSWQELPGAAFHEAAHNKSQQGMGMHNNQNGLLKEIPSLSSAPTKENLEFFAKHALNKVKQRPGLVAPNPNIGRH
jgi:hypothetical protein